MRVEGEKFNVKVSTRGLFPLPPPDAFFQILVGILSLGRSKVSTRNSKPFLFIKLP